MIDCAYCERPLICDACRTPYKPPTRKNTRHSRSPRSALPAPSAATVLVCHWCKTPYEGLTEEKDEAGSAAGLMEP